MCTVSFIGDQWAKSVPERYPSIPFDSQPTYTYFPSPTREEFDALKKEVEALKELLKAAKIYDEATGQPDCEVDEKVELVKRVAEMVGVDLEDLFEDREQYQ